MSGIYGVYRPRGQPVTRSALDAMHEVFAQWFDDGRGTWLEATQGIGMGHTQCWNTPESRLESQPEVDGPEGDRLVITADLRLDNRAELIATLGIKTPPTRVTDSQLVLAAYRKWGEESPHYLLGDFAYALWDERRRRLFCARDHVGIKQLYYSPADDGLVFANDIRPLLTQPGVPRDLDRESVAHYLLVGGLNHEERTFFRCVRKLPPGSALVAAKGELQSWCYWRPEDSPAIRLRDAGAYEAALQELLQDAVLQRLRTDYEVGAHLSGGLDSSTITALAAPVAGAGGRTLHTYNWIHAPGPGDDPHQPEWGAGPLVARHCGVPHHLSELTSNDIFSALCEHDIAWGDTTELWYEHPILRTAAARGARVMLSGWGGDQLLTNQGAVANTELFWHGRMVRAFTNIARDARAAPAPLRRFAGSCYRELLRPVVRAGIEFLRPPGWASPYYRGYLRIAGPEIQALAPRHNPNYDPFPAFSLRRQQLAQYRSGFIHGRLAAHAATGLTRGVEYRYPLLDKRLVEFALGIPPDLYWREGIGRHLFRRVASRLLPHAIAWGTLKDEPARVARLAELEQQALGAWHQRAVREGWLSPSSGLVDEDAFLTLLESVLRESAGATDNESFCHRLDTVVKGAFMFKLKN